MSKIVLFLHSLFCKRNQSIVCMTIHHKRNPHISHLPKKYAQAIERAFKGQTFDHPSELKPPAQLVIQIALHCYRVKHQSLYTGAAAKIKIKTGILNRIIVNNDHLRLRCDNGGRRAGERCSRLNLKSALKKLVKTDLKGSASHYD